MKSENFKSLLLLPPLLLLLLLLFIAPSSCALSDVNTSLTSSGSLERGSVFDSQDRFDSSSILLLNFMISMNTSMTMMQTSMISMNTTLYILVDRVESLSNETNRRFDEVGKNFTSMDKKIDDLKTYVDNKFDEVGKNFTSMDKKIDDLKTYVDNKFDVLDEKLATMDKRFDSVDKTLQELLSSTLTPRSADLVDACARKSVFLVTFSSSNGGDLNENGSNLIRHCSAFSYKPFPSRDAVIVTASHCFFPVFNKTSFLNKTPFVVFLSILDQHVRHECSVLDFRGSPDDATILSCPTLINIPGLLSSNDTRLSQLVAITGFAADTYNTSTTFVNSHHIHNDNTDSPSFALNVDFSRIVSIAGPPHKLQDGSVCVSSADEMTWPVHPSGFVDRRVTQGLSGGPILDLTCGVIGIAHGRSCNAGVFMNLLGVDEYILTMEKTNTI